MAVRLVWDENYRADVHSVDELNRLLEKLTVQAEHDMPLSVELYSGNKTSMYIVVGSDISPVAHFLASGHPPVSSSCGQYSGHDGFFEYNHRGHHTVIHKKFTVPIGEAIKALIYFFQTGRRPENIVWE
jgi:hypothetical protein